MSFVRERMSMDGRVAVVTGGGQGVGRAIALGLADAGARVVIGEINEETGPRTAAEIEGLGGEALWLLTDVRKHEDIIALVAAAQEHFGRIDSMFNNAGGNFQLPAIDMSPNGFDAIVRMNLRSMFLGSQAAARTMLSEGHGGSIVSTSSVAGLRSGGNQTAVYAASKAGIMGMTRALAAEWGEHGIRVNSVAPGAVDTAGRTRNMHGDPWDRSAGNPLGRIAQPEDIAGAAVFLASDLAGHITGQVLAVDGGASTS